MSQVGRISGPLLYANLERNGIDLAFETDLIYLDVTGNKIGIRNASPSNEIQISDTTRTVSLIADTQADIANLNIQSSTIQPFPGSLILDARYTITANRVKTDNLLLDDDRISTYTADTNIELRPNQTGATEFNNLWVENNLNVTGDVRLDGDITFGNADTDSVTFDADVTSNIIPDTDVTYNLGTSGNRWQTIEARLLNGQDIDAQVALIGNVDIGTRPGNLYYVSTNGDNANVGDHPQGPFLTIDHAVTQATAGDTILVFPGEYEETCPIEVPAGVAIRGTNMRNVIVKPVSNDNDVDIFLLNGESTVTDLTVKDFYYNSSNDTGYAFRFANNATITTRSPYIQNVTVITAGSVTSASDPRGFAEGDAGKGALVDGASVLNTSKEASMLFHSITFITPGVDAITMTNGVRVEWLNSFTYFANRGLYAVNGSTGHLSTDGVTVKYGAELRSIGSACVYGSYGAVADGSDTLMYLIQHNMGYIGVDNYVDNDPSRAIQTNEIVKLNSGQIYYQTVNHFGDFRIGDNFFVNQETGESSIVITQGEVQGFGRLRVTATASGNVTIIDGEQITTGNLLFTGNRISSVLGNVDIASAGAINLLDDTNILGNLSISGDLTFDGSLNLLGNEATDTLTFNVDIDQDLTPSTTLSFDLGSSSKEWHNVWLSEAQIGDLQIRDNYITTDISSADLELRANGAGKILIPANNVQVDNNLTVSDATDLQDLSITGLLDQSGNRTQTGDVTLNGELTVDNVYIEDNFITTTTGDLTLVSTNEVHVDSNDVEITQDLSVSAATDLQSLEITGLLVQTGDRNQTGDYSVTNLTITGDLDASSQQQFEEILFDGNVVSTTTTSADLELRASGTGEVLVPNNNVQIDNNLEVQGTTFTQDVNNSQTVEAVTITTGDINITGNVIDTSTPNSDLELRADLTGTQTTHSGGTIRGISKLTSSNGVSIILWQQQGPGLPTFNLPANLIVGQQYTLTFDYLGSTVEVPRTFRGHYLDTDAANNAGFGASSIGLDEFVTFQSFTELVNGITIGWGTPSGTIGNNGNNPNGWYNGGNWIDDGTELIITTTQYSKIVISDNAIFENNLTVSGITDLQSTNVTGALTHIGDTTQTGDRTQTNMTVNGEVTFDRRVDFKDVSVDGNVIINTIAPIYNTVGGTLRLNEVAKITDVPGSVGSTAIWFYDDDTASYQLNQDATTDRVMFLTSTSNTIDYGVQTGDYFSITKGSTIFVGQITEILGVQFIDAWTYTEVFKTGYIDDNVDGVTEVTVTVGTELVPDPTSNLELRASGSGEILIPNNNVQVNNDLFAANINTGDINVNNDLVLDELVITDSNIEINENYITTDTSHSNLELRANNAGEVLVPNNDVTVEQDLTVNGTIDIDELSVNGSITQTGDVNQTGDLDIIGDFILDGDFTISDQPFQFEDIRVDGNVITTTASTANLDLRANGTGSIYVNDSVQITNNLTVRDITATDIILDNSFALENLVSSTDIEIFDNVITTTNSHSNLELRANGTGYVYLQELGFEQDTLSTVDTAITLAVRNLDIEATGSLKIPVGRTQDRIDSIPEQIVDGGDADDVLVTVYDGGDAGTVFTADDLLLNAGSAPTPEGNPGDIRFNTDVGLFEGYSTTHQFFGGVYSEDASTSIYADTNNQIVLKVNNVQVGVVDSDSFTINGLQVDDIIIDNTLISTNVSDSDLELIPSGTGRIKKDDLEFKDNIFYNLSTGGLMLASTDNGYYKISGTNGVVIPKGTDADRGANPQTGEIRWNTTQGIKEVYNGTEWIPARGIIDNVTAAEFGIILDEYVLIFG